MLMHFMWSTIFKIVLFQHGTIEILNIIYLYQVFINLCILYYNTPQLRLATLPVPNKPQVAIGYHNGQHSFGAFFSFFKKILFS